MCKKDEIVNLIDIIRTNILNYSLKEISSNIDKLIILILSYDDIGKLSKEKLDIFNNILENINISIENSDYMLLSDILKFELEYFFYNL